MDLLPLEIIYEIFDYLNLLDLWICKCVSSNWRNLLINYVHSTPKRKRINGVYARRISELIDNEAFRYHTTLNIFPLTFSYDTKIFFNVVTCSPERKLYIEVSLNYFLDERKRGMMIETASFYVLWDTRTIIDYNCKHTAFYYKFMNAIKNICN